MTNPALRERQYQAFERSLRTDAGKEAQRRIEEKVSNTDVAAVALDTRKQLEENLPESSSR